MSKHVKYSTKFDIILSCHMHFLLGIRGCLVSVAIESQDPQVSDIHQQLNHDNAYIDKLSHLVRSLYYQLSLRANIVLAATCLHPYLLLQDQGPLCGPCPG